MHQPKIYPFARNRSPELTVHYRAFSEAQKSYPNCERTALRAFARSEAARLANALILPVVWEHSFSNVVALFADPDKVNAAALRQRRFDFVVMLLQTGKFERRIARRLIAEGKLSGEVLS